MAAALPFILLIVREWGLQPDLVNSDYAQYIAHAQALVDGRPYTDTGYIFTPYEPYFAPVAYPPGFPLILALAFAVFGQTVAVAKVVTFVLSASLLPLAGAYFARTAGWRIGVGVVFMLGLSSSMLPYFVAPLTDLPMTALVWLALLLVDTARGWTLRRAFVVTVVTGVVVLFRPHGLILIAALGLWGLLNVSRIGWKSLAPAATLMGATVIGRLIIGSASLRGFPDPSRMFLNLITPDLRYHYVVFESHLSPFPGDLANDVFHVFTMAIMLVGLVEFSLRHRRSLAVSYGILYTLALASLQEVGTRFAFPLTPLFVFGLLNGVQVVTRALYPRRGDWAALGFAALLAIVVTVRALRTDAPPALRDEPDYVALIEHLRSRVLSGEELRVVSFRPRILALETGASGMVLLRSPDPGSHVAEWCRASITHVVLGGFGFGVRGSAVSRNALESRSGAATTEFENEAYELVRIDAAALGCEPPR